MFSESLRIIEEHFESQHEYVELQQVKNTLWQRFSVAKLTVTPLALIRLTEFLNPSVSQVQVLLHYGDAFLDFITFNDFFPAILDKAL